jgi:large repetitive protein
VITAVNAAPIAVGDPTPTTAYTVRSGDELRVAAPGVLGNDSDIDSPGATGPALRVAPLATLNPDGSFATAHGTAKLNADGSFTYRSMSGYIGPDSFVYVVRDVDPTRTSNAATVSITVTRATGRPPR